MKQVHSTLVLLLSRGPNGHIRQPVPIHISQHCQGCPKAAPGVARLPSQDSITLPLSSLQNGMVSGLTHSQTPPSPGLITTHPPGKWAHGHLAPLGLLVEMRGPNEDQVRASISIHIHGAEGGPEVGADLEGRVGSHPVCPLPGSRPGPSPASPQTPTPPPEALHPFLSSFSAPGDPLHTQPGSL